MRQMLLCFLLLPGFTVLAAPQFSQAECQKLNSERLAIKKKLRQPHDMAQAKKLQQREEEVTLLLNRHCKKPIPNPPQL